MFIKRNGEKNDCIIAGMAVGDLKEKEYDGKKFYEVGISMNENTIVNVAVWGRKPVDIKKYDKILAAGQLKATQKDDKVYYSMNADFITREATIDVKEDVPEGLIPIDDDDSLPF